MTRLRLCFICLAYLLLAACGTAQPAPTPTEIAQVQITDTLVLPTATATALPATNTATPTPTATIVSPTETATPLPTNTPTATPIPLPPPPGEIIFLWNPEPIDPTGPQPQNLYFVKPGNAAGEWEIETALTEVHGAGLYLSPDGTKFAIRQFEDGNGDGIVSLQGTADYSNIFLYPLSDQILTRLTEAEFANNIRVSWLPDNQQFTYTSYKDVYLYDLESRISSKILSFSGPIFSHQWSPDGRWLAVVSAISDEPGLQAEQRLDLYHAEINSLIPLVSKMGLSTLSWSPNNQWLAFNYEYNQGLLVTSMNGLDPIELVASNSLSFVSWSPDGQWLAFTTQFDTGNLNVWNPNTQTIKQLLAGNGRVSQPIWSPDSQHLAVALNAEAESSLLIVNVIDKTTDTLLIGPEPVPEPGPARWPLEMLTWSPDGQWILFEASGKDSRNFSIVNSSSGAAFVVLDFTGTAMPENIYWLP